jgi:hypothetical protein
MYLPNKTNNNSEIQIINQIVRENNPNNVAFRINTNKKPDINTVHKTQDIPSNRLENNKKWAAFTYVGKETRHITKLFKNMNIKPAFRTTNTIKKHLFPNQRTVDIYDKSDCPRQYIGQTGRTFKVRFIQRTYKGHK